MGTETDTARQSRRIADDVRYRVVGGQAVIIVQEAGEAIVLNAVGTRVLEAIARGMTCSQIVADLCDHFAVDSEQASADVAAYLGELTEAGVLTPAANDD